MLRLALNNLRLVAKKRNIGSYKSMSRNQLINLISSTPRSAFKIK